MKRTLLLLITLVSTAANTFAMQIENGKLLSHRDTTGKNARFTFKETKIDVDQFLKSRPQIRRDSAIANEYISVTTKLAPISILSSPDHSINQVTISNSSDNMLMIMNFTADVQAYKISHEICFAPFTNTDNITCSGYTDEVVINPNGYAFSIGDSSLYTHLTPGKYIALISTTIINEANNRYLDSNDSSIFEL